MASIMAIIGIFVGMGIGEYYNGRIDKIRREQLEDRRQAINRAKQRGKRVVHYDDREQYDELG